MHCVASNNIDPSYMVCVRHWVALCQHFSTPSWPIPFRLTGISWQGRVFLDWWFSVRKPLCVANWSRSGPLVPVHIPSHGQNVIQGVGKLAAICHKRVVVGAASRRSSAGGAASCQVMSPGLSSLVSSTLVEGAPRATNLTRPAFVPSPLHLHIPAH